MNQRRTGIRIPVGLRAQIRWRNRAGSYRQAQGKAANISGNGLFVAMPVRLGLNTPITVTMTLPALASKIRVQLLCQGRVTRWNKPGELRGLGAIIDDYQLRPRR